MKHITFAVLLTFFSTILHSQSNLHIGIGYEYWNHSDLFGVVGSIQYSYNFSQKHGLSAEFSYGSGEKNGLKKFESKVDPSIKATTLYTDTNFNNIGWQNNFTDFARQLKLKLLYNYELYNSSKVLTNIGVGAYLGSVQNFLIVDVLNDYELNVYPAFVGPVNLVLTSQNNFLIGGLAADISAQIKTSGKIDPVLNLSAGIGPKRSSYIRLGVIFGGAVSR